MIYGSAPGADPPPRTGEDLRRTDREGRVSRAPGGSDRGNRSRAFDSEPDRFPFSPRGLLQYWHCRTPLSLRDRDEPEVPLGVALCSRVHRAAGGVLIPSVLGFGFGYALSLPLVETLCIAIALSITSIGISVRILVDLRSLQTRMGSIIVGAAVFDDIIGIVLLGVLLSMISHGRADLAGVERNLLLAILFLLALLTVGRYLIRWIIQYSRRGALHEMTFSSAILIALASAYLASLAGLHIAIGGFIAGLLLGDMIQGDRTLKDSISDFSFGFFTAFFFASVGLLVRLEWGILINPMTLLLIAAGLLGKTIGGYLGSILFLRNHLRSLIVGLGLTPRGEIALVVMKTALIAGALSVSLYAMLTLMLIVCTLLAPTLLKKMLERERRPMVTPVA
ncbi:MAG: cation:proton antiporter [Methanomicrobiales archaeon]|nr:cation:proton antiporter [Methanomicrobiales archaeon]